MCRPLLRPSSTSCSPSKCPRSRHWSMNGSRFNWTGYRAAGGPAAVGPPRRHFSPSTEGLPANPTSSNPQVTSPELLPSTPLFPSLSIATSSNSRMQYRAVHLPGQYRPHKQCRAVELPCCSLNKLQVYLAFSLA
mmetsp:Transcript_2809/g.6165  ORF Transcript_2809/g.6165 Transcript_2809/m.6165 type:complete len:135 (-) Transcript_2809:393-797(-)